MRARAREDRERMVPVDRGRGNQPIIVERWRPERGDARGRVVVIEEPRRGRELIADAPIRSNDFFGFLFGGGN